MRQSSRCLFSVRRIKHNPMSASEIWKIRTNGQDDRDIVGERVPDGREHPAAGIEPHIMGAVGKAPSEKEVVQRQRKSCAGTSEKWKGKGVAAVHEPGIVQIRLFGQGVVRGFCRKRLRRGDRMLSGQIKTEIRKSGIAAAIAGKPCVRSKRRGPWKPLLTAAIGKRGAVRDLNIGFFF